MEITSTKLPAIGIFKEGQLVSIVVQNGKPLFYEVTEMNNKGVEDLLEVNKAQN